MYLNKLDKLLDELERIFSRSFMFNFEKLKHGNERKVERNIKELFTIQEHFNLKKFLKEVNFFKMKFLFFHDVINSNIN